MAKTTDTQLSDFDQRIAELTQQVKDRFQALKQEIDAGQKELERLSEHHARLTGKALLTASNGVERGGRSANGSNGSNGSAGAGGGSTAGKAPKTTKSGKKRSRKPSPPVEWLQETLSRKGMTVKQLQEAAEQDGYSGLRLPEILKGNKQVKSQPGEKQEGVKGIPAAVWGVK